MTVYNDIATEHARQDAKWGANRSYPDGTGRPGDAERAAEARARCKANPADGDNWRDIMDEEVCEAFAETDPAKLRAELVQVAALAVQWIEAIDRRRTRLHPVTTAIARTRWQGMPVRVAESEMEFNAAPEPFYRHYCTVCGRRMVGSHPGGCHCTRADWSLAMMYRDGIPTDGVVYTAERIEA